MAILFDDAQLEFLEHAAAVQATVPLSLSAWARTDVPATQQSVLGLGFTGAPRYIRIKISNSTALAQITGGGTDIDLTGGAISANTWHHIGGTFTEAEVGIYVDGAETLNGAGSTVPAGLNLTTIGVRHANAFAHYMSGDIAMPAIWSVALTAAEMAALAAGWPPWQIRPNQLGAYWPLNSINYLKDIRSTYDMTAFNTPVTSTDHPPILHPGTGIWTPPPLAAAVTGNPWNYYAQVG